MVAQQQSFGAKISGIYSIFCSIAHNKLTKPTILCLEGFMCVFQSVSRRKIHASADRFEYVVRSYHDVHFIFPKQIVYVVNTAKPKQEICLQGEIRN